jgi:hypothetical protein
MEKEEVINEIEEEIKKAKADPQDFEIEITDDPKEEAKDLAEEKKEVRTKCTIRSKTFSFRARCK